MLNLKNGFMLLGRRAISTAELSNGFVGQGLEVISSALRVKPSIASVAMRTSEYAVGAGKLVKASGTDETGNLLRITYLDRT